MAMVDLTKDGIEMVMMKNKLQNRLNMEIKPVVLQVAEIELVSSEHGYKNKLWHTYEILLSDGSYTQLGLFAEKQDDLKNLQKGSIVMLTNYDLYHDPYIKRQRPIMIMDVDVIVEKCDPIGEPKPYPNKPRLAAIRPSTPVQPKIEEVHIKHEHEHDTKRQRIDTSPRASISRRETDEKLMILESELYYFETDLESHKRSVKDIESKIAEIKSEIVELMKTKKMAASGADLITKGWIAMISNRRTEANRRTEENIKVTPVLQVADIRLLESHSKPSFQWPHTIELWYYFEIMLSDGSHTQQGLFSSTDHNDLDRFKKGSIVKLKKYAFIYNIPKELTIMIMDIEVIVEECLPIGEPEPYPNKPRSPERPSTPVEPTIEEYRATLKMLDLELKNLESNYETQKRMFEDMKLEIVERKAKRMKMVEEAA